jgi:hypothetical protein
MYTGEHSRRFDHESIMGDIYAMRKKSTAGGGCATDSMGENFVSMNLFQH